MLGPWGAPQEGGYLANPALASKPPAGNRAEYDIRHHPASAR